MVSNRNDAESNKTRNLRKLVVRAQILITRYLFIGDDNEQIKRNGIDTRHSLGKRGKRESGNAIQLYRGPTGTRARRHDQGSNSFKTTSGELLTTEGPRGFFDSPGQVYL